MSLYNKISRSLFKAILTVFVISSIYIGNMVFFPAGLPQKNYKLVIEKQQDLHLLATNLQRLGVIKSRYIFLFLLRLMHKDRSVTAGLYILKNPMSIWRLIDRITNGYPDQLSVTIVDGWQINQIRNYINSLDNIQHLSARMTDEQLKELLKIKAPNLEGVFYPSTYFIVPHQTDLDIYQMSYRLMQDKLTDLFLKRSKNTVYDSPYQLLIVASLIQKETSKIDDMLLISTVFNNRLRLHMKLQDDPSVFYGLKSLGFDRITRPDFQIDTPYNTYLRQGLPPTPICSPSYEALQAASRPLNKEELLYFVAVGSGNTQFSATYAQHISKVNKFLKKRLVKKKEKK